MNIAARVLLSASSGALIAYGYLFNGAVAWFCMVPALIAGAGSRKAGVLLNGFIMGISTGAILLYGISLYGICFYLILVLYCGFNGALILLMISYIDKAFGPYMKALIIPSIWVSFEFLRTLTPFSFPLSIANTQSANIEVIQIASLLGAYSVSFTIALGNYAIFVLVRSPGRRENLIIIASFISILAMTLFFGKTRIEDYAMRSGRDLALKVAVAQGSIPMKTYNAEPGLPETGRYIERTYLDLFEEASRSKPDLIVGPETPVNKYISDEAYASRLKAISKSSATYILTGAPEFDSGKQYNGVFLISPDGKIVDKYRKSHTVPIAEKYLRGGRPVPVMFMDKKLGVVICFESIYPHILRSLSAKGAGLLFVLTNDSGFGETAIPYLHARESVLRAVENGRWVIRAAQSGVSMLIDPCGRIMNRLGLFEKGIMAGEVKYTTLNTLYINTGDIFPLTCLVIMIAGLLRASRQFKRLYRRQ